MHREAIRCIAQMSSPLALVGVLQDASHFVGGVFSKGDAVLDGSASDLCKREVVLKEWILFLESLKYFFVVEHIDDGGGDLLGEHLDLFVFWFARLDEGW